MHYESGMSYFCKESTKETERKAFEYFIIAANMGHIRSQHKVGLYYETGIGTEMDKKKSFEYYLMLIKDI